MRGLAINLRFLEGLIRHPKFKSADYTTSLIDDNPERFDFPRRRDRATRLLNFIGDTIVNANPAIEGRRKPSTHDVPQIPQVSDAEPLPKTRERLQT